MAEKIHTVCLPDIGEGVVEGEVIEWLKNVGDIVIQDEPVVIVMTDKATVELPSPYPGKVHKHYYKKGQIAIRDQPLYDLLVDLLVDLIVEQEVPISVEKSKQSSENATSSLEFSSQSKKKDLMFKGKDSTEKKIKALPKVRYQAKKWNLDLNEIEGSGPEGRITEEDLLKKIKSTPSEKKEIFLDVQSKDEERKLSGIRRIMALKMGERHIPQFSYFEEVEVKRLIQLRENMKGKAEGLGIHLSFMPFFIRALSLTINQYPELNASIDLSSEKVILHHQHNIGIAVASKEGLVVPVLKGVQTMNLKKIIESYEEFKKKISEERLSSDEMKEATITISNFGVLGGEAMWATPMILHPQVAILGLAKIREVPVAKEGEVVLRELLPLSWSFDHRLIDGELAAKISHRYCTLLKDPALLL